MTILEAQNNFDLAEKKFDAKPNAKTAENLKIAREQLNKALRDATTYSDHYLKKEEERRNFWMSLTDSIIK